MSELKITKDFMLGTEFTQIAENIFRVITPCGKHEFIIKIPFMRLKSASCWFNSMFLRNVDKYSQVCELYYAITDERLSHDELAYNKYHGQLADENSELLKTAKKLMINLEAYGDMHNGKGWFDSGFKKEKELISKIEGK